jgi:hypothetical protein
MRKVTITSRSFNGSSLSENKPQNTEENSENENQELESQQKRTKSKSFIVKRSAHAISDSSFLIPKRKPNSEEKKVVVRAKKKPKSKKEIQEERKMNAKRDFLERRKVPADELIQTRIYDRINMDTSLMDTSPDDLPSRRIEQTKTSHTGTISSRSKHKSLPKDALKEDEQEEKENQRHNHGEMNHERQSFLLKMREEQVKELLDQKGKDREKIFHLEKKINEMKIENNRLKDELETKNKELKQIASISRQSIREQERKDEEMARQMQRDEEFSFRQRRRTMVDFVGAEIDCSLNTIESELNFSDSDEENSSIEEKKKESELKVENTSSSVSSSSSSISSSSPSPSSSSSSRVRRTITNSPFPRPNVSTVNTRSMTSTRLLGPLPTTSQADIQASSWEHTGSAHIGSLIILPLRTNSGPRASRLDTENKNRPQNPNPNNRGDEVEHDFHLGMTSFLRALLQESHGASESTINRLPTSRFRKTDKKTTSQSVKGVKQEKPSGSEAGETPMCSICLEEFKEDDEIRTLRCFHIFHKIEIDRWLRGNPTCPNCKTPVNA